MLSASIHRIIPAFILEYSNSDFTNPHEMLLPEEPQDCTSDYTHMGVKYTGLETCRHLATTVDTAKKQLFFQHESYNWVKIALKERAEISEIKVSTKWFTGNQVQTVAIFLIDELTGVEKEVLTKSPLQPDSDHCFTVEPTFATEAFVKMYYEGGISRIHFCGKKAEQQLAAEVNILEKATISHVSNEHYGHPKMAVYGCRKESFMRGWESARTGFGEQALFHLEEATVIKKIIVDTYLHRLNAPLTCHVYGLNISKEDDLDLCIKQKPKWALLFDNGLKVVPDNFKQYMLEQKYLKEAVSNPTQFQIYLHLDDDSSWQAILPFEVLRRDTYHRFSSLENDGSFTHLLYMHYPNGGIHGLKIFTK